MKRLFTSPHTHSRKIRRLNGMLAEQKFLIYFRCNLAFVQLNSIYIHEYNSQFYFQSITKHISKLYLYMRKAAEDEEDQKKIEIYAT